MDNLYDEYAVVNAKIANLIAEKDVLKEKILTGMVEKGETKVNTGVGSFAIAKLKSWTYPEKVLAIGEKFKAEKAKAESTGDATFVENDSLRFTMLKL
jgi:hypothetical protein